MSAASATLMGRRAAERQMVDACVITRPTGQRVTDPTTGKVTIAETTVYTGKCQVVSKNSSTAEPEAGGHSFIAVSRTVKIPMNAADVKDGDVIRMTASKLNAFTAGKKYRVDGYTPDSYDTAARLPVKELTS
ncbi:head-to-tail stopper [Arthrobacter phage Bridgette]|uniref:Head-to-tail stopper n=1 Tax=Arthrobacter phage Bridgette TaxID=2419949 RepID=A0A3G2KE76_9CAUD|nr:head-to-tail stopper [Arthrobacter phage Bridgette]AYN57277.1 head-to-tail stopper [Arthrobacter phage Bridgette]